MLRIILYAFMILLGGYMAYSQISKGNRCTQPTTATITGTERKRYSGRHTRRKYAPVVEFEADGQTVTGTADIDSSFASKFKEGETLEIRYNPSKPEEFVVEGKSFRSGVLGGGLLIVLGILGMIFGRGR